MTKTEFNYQDYLMLLLSVKARISHIENIILPIFCKFDDNELAQMYKSEIDRMNELYNKLKKMSYENFL